MKIRMVKINQINPAPYNPRKDLKPGDVEYEKLKNSIVNFGYVEPMVWNQKTGNLVGGHQRYKILVEQGLKELEVSIVDLPLEKEKVLNLALNKIQGQWDQDKLAILLEELSQVPNFEVGLTGFELPEISNILDNYSESHEDNFDFDAAVNSIEEPVTKRRDLIKLGENRLLCGDSANPNDVEFLMGDYKAHMLFCDPPFNCNYRNNRPNIRQSKKPPKWKNIYRDNLPQGEYEAWLEKVFSNINNYLSPGSSIYIWNGHRQFGPMYLMLLKLDFQIGTVIVWAKPNFSISYADYNQQVEFCLYGWKKGEGGHHWYGPHNETTLWEERRDSAKSLVHPTQKPISLGQRAIRNSSARNNITVDTFLGSGSTLIAAQSLGRRCFGIEIDPRYCDAIVKRYIAYVGESNVTDELKEKYLKKEVKNV